MSGPIDELDLYCAKSALHVGGKGRLQTQYDDEHRHDNVVRAQ